jgi:hypothetical protein
MYFKGARRTLLYVALMTAMVFSAWQLGETTSHAGVCCQYGSECEGSNICCSPASVGGEPCMAGDKRGYCRTSCGMDTQ